MPISTVINYINFVVNFFVYYYYMASFRKRFLQIFCCKPPENKDSGMSTRMNTSLSTVSKSVDYIKESPQI